MQVISAERDKNIINGNEFRVIGMSRSGNHAIINWIIQQVKGRYCFLNCVEPKTNPFCTARPLSHDITCLTNYDEFDLTAEQKGAFSVKDYLIYSYEDCFLGMVCSDLFEERHDEFVGCSRRRTDILILRDPFNLFASRKKASYSQVSVTTAVRIWKQHAREFLGKRRYLNQNKVLINYNSWTRDLAYRRSIARRLGLTFTDAGIHTVPHCGEGSSFDGRRFDGRAGEMKVLERWRYLADQPSYREIFDPEMVYLSNEIFGHLSGTERLLSLLIAEIGLG